MELHISILIVGGIELLRLNFFSLGIDSINLETFWLVVACFTESIVIAFIKRFVLFGVSFLVSSSLRRFVQLFGSIERVSDI